MDKSLTPQEDILYYEYRKYKTGVEGDKMKKFGAAIILAGGKSSRMGFDKQFIEINETRLINRIASTLAEEFEDIIIITNKPEEYKDFKYRIATDIIKDKGPLGGIHIGLQLASSQYAFVMACDMPNIHLDYIRYMKNIIELQEVQGCVTKYGDWIEPFHNFYSKDMIAEIEKNLAQDRRSINFSLKNLNIHYVEEEIARKFSPTWDIFLNLNMKEDLHEYLRERSE